MIFDSHTHRTDSGYALINVEPGFAPEPEYYYSIGIHPWHADRVTGADLTKLEAQAVLPQVKAIGETGLDRNTPGYQQQLALLTYHIGLSERLHKPLLLHVVRYYNEIIQLCKRLKPTQPWIIHGFRGNPQQTEQLLNHGFYLSLGERDNPQSAAIIPSHRLLVETDTSAIGIDSLAGNLPQYDNTLPLRLFRIN